MSTRIRYGKDGLSTSKFFHPTNGARYLVKLDTENKQWMILDDASGLVARSGYQSNLALMKKEAKKALQELGIEFESETRGSKLEANTSATL